MFSSQGSSSPKAFESSWKLMPPVHVSSYKFIYELVWAQKIMWANHLEHALPSYQEPKQMSWKVQPFNQRQKSTTHQSGVTPGHSGSSQYVWSNLANWFRGQRRRKRCQWPSGQPQPHGQPPLHWPRRGLGLCPSNPPSPIASALSLPHAPLLSPREDVEICLHIFKRNLHCSFWGGFPISATI